MEEINDKQDFIRFVESLVTDLRNNPNDWENRSLESYLEAISNWVEDMEGYYLNNNLPMPESINWNVFADILIAAKMYE